MLPIRIKGDGPEHVGVQDQALLVSVMPYPPLDVPNNTIPFINVLTVNGDLLTRNLNVDGSVNPIDAFIGPPVIGDLYITTANILIADNAAIALNKFGGITALTNGINFFVENANERIEISSELKTNFDMIRISTLTAGTGGKNDAFQLSNTDPSNNDGYNPILDFTRVSPLGIRLRKDTKDKLGITIRDDLTSVATFDIVINGFIRI